MPTEAQIQEWAERRRKIVAMHDNDGLNFTEIGDIERISRERVRQLYNFEKQRMEAAEADERKKAGAGEVEAGAKRTRKNRTAVAAGTADE